LAQVYLYCFFFFSSRRRHTRFKCDWSSDVCSSDLTGARLLTAVDETLKPAAIGFSSHSGWAAAVCLGCPVSSPFVLDRSRLLLTSWPLPREPYHDAKRAGPDKAEEIVTGAAEEARVLAAEARAAFGALVGMQ